MAIDGAEARSCTTDIYSGSRAERFDWLDQSVLSTAPVNPSSEAYLSASIHSWERHHGAAAKVSG
jgi:hypothetical protein